MQAPDCSFGPFEIDTHWYVIDSEGDRPRVVYPQPCLLCEGATASPTASPPVPPSSDDDYPSGSIVVSGGGYPGEYEFLHYDHTGRGVWVSSKGVVIYFNHHFHAEHDWRSSRFDIDLEDSEDGEVPQLDLADVRGHSPGAWVIQKDAFHGGVLLPLFSAHDGAVNPCEITAEWRVKISIALPSKPAHPQPVLTCTAPSTSSPTPSPEVLPIRFDSTTLVA